MFKELYRKSDRFNSIFKHKHKEKEKKYIFGIGCVHMYGKDK